jgi:hypothetical protein
LSIPALLLEETIKRGTRVNLATLCRKNSGTERRHIRRIHNAARGSHRPLDP